MFKLFDFYCCRTNHKTQRGVHIMTMSSNLLNAWTHQKHSRGKRGSIWCASWSHWRSITSSRERGSGCWLKCTRRTIGTKIRESGKLLKWKDLSIAILEYHQWSRSKWIWTVKFLQPRKALLNIYCRSWSSTTLKRYIILRSLYTRIKYIK